MGLAEDFEVAAASALNLPAATNEDMLTLYALFKQSKVGDCDTSRPGMFDMKARAKWDAWEKAKGLSKDTAMQAYIDKVTALA